MKKMTMAAAALTALIAASTTTSVFADDTDPATPSVTSSTGKIVFTPKETPTDPVDPTDPDNPGKVDPDDPDNPGTGNNGPLSLDYVSNIDFDTHEVAGGTYNAMNATPYLQVTDSRETGNWALTASMTQEFTNATTGAPLTGAIMHWTNGEAVSTTGNTATAPELQDFDLAKDSADVAVMNATDAKGFAGKGTWVDRFVGTEGANSNVTLEVPGVPNAGTYNAEITWSLADTPIA